jgi:hypothetical protein
MYYLNRKVDYKKHALSKKKTQSDILIEFKSQNNSVKVALWWRFSTLIFSDLSIPLVSRVSKNIQV